MACALHYQVLSIVFIRPPDLSRSVIRSCSESLVKAGAIIGDGDRKRWVHAKPSKKTNVLFLAKLAPPSTS